MLRFALAVSLVLALFAAGVIGTIFGHVSRGLCLTVSGKGSTVLVPGRGC